MSVGGTKTAAALHTSLLEPEAGSVLPSVFTTSRGGGSGSSSRMADVAVGVTPAAGGEGGEVREGVAHLVVPAAVSPGNDAADSARAGDDAPVVTPTDKPISHKSLTYRVSRALLVLVYLAVAVCIAIAIWQLAARHSENHIIAWAVAAMCVAIAVPLTFHDIHMHLVR